MKRFALVLSLVALSAVVSSAQPGDSLGVRPDQIPATLQPALARAEQGMNALQAALLARLREQMAAGGPSSAVTVCRDEAPAITARVAREQGIALGRTSHGLRNPGNAAPSWAAALVAQAAGTKAGSHSVRVFDLGDRVGVVRPIGFVEMCASCHGPQASIPAPVREVLATAYPSDAAVGFAAGDLRGWMWAEVKQP
jgi:cytochrome c553